MDDDLNEDFRKSSNGGQGNSSWPMAVSNWEQDCINQIENSEDLQIQLDNERSASARKLWVSFQSAALSIAQLYKDRHQNVSPWIPFQNAASSVTSLYKDCSESQKRIAELGNQSGFQRRNKELLAWVKRRKHNIKREELLAFLSGKTYHHHHRSPGSWSGPRQRVVLPEAMSSSNGTMRSPPHITLTKLNLSDLSDSPNPSSTNAVVNNEEGDLQTFREALALSVVGLRNSPQHSGYSSNSGRRNNCNRVLNSSNNSSSLAELNDFITEEFTRHVESRKRSSSSTDVVMDSPTHSVKRSKFI